MNIEKECVEGLLRKIERLQAERDCYHAWQDKACKLFEAVLKQDDIVDTVLQYSIDTFLNETPQQCLREVQAEAGRKGFIEGYMSCWFDHYGTRQCEYSISCKADEHAAKVRQGGAE